MKLFQSLTSGFGEENFIRISSCPYSAKRPHSPEQCLFTDQNLSVIWESRLWIGKNINEIIHKRKSRKALIGAVVAEILLK